MFFYQKLVIFHYQSATVLFKSPAIRTDFLDQSNLFFRRQEILAEVSRENKRIGTSHVWCESDCILIIKTPINLIFRWNWIIWWRVHRWPSQAGFRIFKNFKISSHLIGWELIWKPSKSIGFVYMLDGHFDKNGNSILIFPKDAQITPIDFIKVVKYVKKR